jgi:Histidine kinase-, DNA gyrase B-, and HSP90-like ATPase
MGLGQQVPALDASAENDMHARARRGTEDVRAIERRQLYARLRAVVVPGLEELVDPDADPADLIARADAHARRLRRELDGPDPSGALLSLDAHAQRAREDEREWVRGHLHDTALQILEFIAGDGFGTGLSASKISNLAGGAAHDLRGWIDASEEPADAHLLPELELVTAEARTFDPSVRLVVGDGGVPPTPPTAEQVLAIAGAVREAVTNARKHARASQVVVRVEIAGDGQTVVTVTDDGIGFDPDRAAGGSGLGVRRSIVGRMRRVGGHASVEDAPGGGTLVKLHTSRQGTAP